MSHIPPRRIIIYLVLRQILSDSVVDSNALFTFSPSDENYSWIFNAFVMLILYWFRQVGNVPLREYIHKSRHTIATPLNDEF